MKIKITWLLILALFWVNNSCKKELLNLRGSKDEGSATQGLSTTGQLTIGERIVEDINKALLNSGYSNEQAETIKAGALEIFIGSNNLATNLFLNTAKIDPNKVEEVAPLIIRGALKAMSDPSAKLSDDGNKIRVANIITEALFKSLGGKITDLSGDTRQNLPGMIAKNAIGALDDGGLKESGLNDGIGSVMAKAVANLDSAGYKAQELEGVLEKITGEGTKGIKEARVEAKNIRHAMHAFVGATTGSLDDAGVPADAIGNHLRAMMNTTVVSLYDLGVTDADMQNVVAKMSEGAIDAAPEANVKDTAKMKNLLDGLLQGTMQGIQSAGISGDRMVPVMDDMVKGSLVGLKNTGLTESQDIIGLVADAAASTIEYLDDIGIKDEATIKAVSKEVAKGTTSALGEHQKSGLLTADEIKSGTGAISKVATKALLTQQRSLKVGHITDYAGSFNDGLTEGLQVSGWQKNDLLAVADTASSASTEALAGDSEFDQKALESHMATVKASMTSVINELEISCKKKQGIWYSDEERCAFPTPTPEANATLPPKEEEDKCYNAGGFIMFKADGSYFCDTGEGGLEIASRDECEGLGYYWILAQGGAYRCQATKPDGACYEKTDSALCGVVSECVWSDGHCQLSNEVSCAINKTSTTCGQNSACVWNSTASYCENAAFVADKEPVNTNATPTWVSTIADFSQAEDSPLAEIKALATDSDKDDALTYNFDLANMSCDDGSWVGLAIDRSTGGISGTPTDADVGSCNIKVDASDGITAISQSFNITVTEVNDIPTWISTISDFSQAEDSPLSGVEAQAVDVDPGATISYSFDLADMSCDDGAWIGLAIDSATGALTGTPTNTDVGDCTINIDAISGADTISQIFTITVVNTNDAPTWTSIIADFTQLENIPLSGIEVNAIDIDPGESITYGFHADGMTCDDSAWIALAIDSGTGAISGTPPHLDAGSCTIKVTATSGSDTISHTFTVTVEPQLPPPEIAGAVTTVIDSPNKVTLNWTSGGGSTVGYRISYNSGGSAPSDCNAGTQVPGEATSYQVTALEPNTQYAFRVCAVNGNTNPNVSPGKDVTVTTPRAARYTQVVGGLNHSCGLSSEGLAYCWGENNYGQLGVSPGSQIPNSPMAVAGSHHFISLAAGGFHTCGIRSDGAVYCWGKDSNGQLGDGTATNASRYEPVAVSGDHRFISLVAGGSHTCGINSHGITYCWGSDSNGELGDGVGTESQHAPKEVLGSHKFISLSAGPDHTCGIRDDGNSYCWGKDDYGQLGNGAGITDQSSPGQVSGSGSMGFISLSAGTHHTCGINIFGEALCWGRDDDGQLGNGPADTIAMHVPDEVERGPTPYISLSAGKLHTCGIMDYGKAFCWGSDANGQLGNGIAVTETYEAPGQVEGSHNFISLAVGPNHTCGISSDGSAFCWGSPFQAYPEPIASTAASAPTMKALAAGQYHTCGLSADGRAYCWGKDASGQLGNGDTLTDHQYEPTEVSGSHRFKALTAGNHFTCGLRDDGAAYCWGLDNYAQLGNGDTITGNQEDPTLVAGDLRFIDISAGLDHACGLCADGRIYCWGRDEYGQLGNGTGVTDVQHDPMMVTLPSSSYGFVALSAGEYHTCAITIGGEAYCWGSDQNGKLGNGSSLLVNQEEPSSVTGDHKFISITAGKNHTCGLTSAGQAYCWGSDSYSQLGNGGSEMGIKDDPFLVSGSYRFKSLTASANHTCGLKDDGTAYCWGKDYMGKLGNGPPTVQQEEPTLVTGDHSFISLVTGENHTCGLGVDGKALCWGSDQYGQLGTTATTTSNQENPVLVAPHGN